MILEAIATGVVGLQSLQDDQPLMDPVFVCLFEDAIPSLDSLRVALVVSAVTPRCRLDRAVAARLLILKEVKALLA